MSEGKSETPERRGLGESAYAELRAEMEAINKDDLLELNMDVENAVTTVLGCLPHIIELTPLMEKGVVAFDSGQFERLPKLAWALRHAHTLYLGASRAGECPPELVKKGARLRRLLIAEAKVLAEHALLDSSRMQNLSLRKGYRNLATDLTVLVTIFRDNWETIQNKCAIPASEIDCAAHLAERFVYAGSRREKRAQTVAKASQMRLRAFTLFYLAYDKLRGQVVCVRWGKRDWNDYAPSLFTKPGGRARSKAEVESKPNGSSSELLGPFEAQEPSPR